MNKRVDTFLAGALAGNIVLQLMVSLVGWLVMVVAMLLVALGLAFLLL
jgi:hypothetical protein